MNVDGKDQKHIEYLLGEYNFEQRYRDLLVQMQDLLEALGVLDKIVINTDLLGQAVLNYFEDVDRLKSFEGIDRTNEAKIYGYETFWLLRDKPIQLVDCAVPYEYLYINEKVVAGMLISKMLKEAGVNPDSVNPYLKPYLELLLYNFRYRYFTQQSLELMITAFFCGCKFECSMEA